MASVGFTLELADRGRRIEAKDVKAELVTFDSKGNVISQERAKATVTQRNFALRELPPVAATRGITGANVSTAPHLHGRPWTTPTLQRADGSRLEQQPGRRVLRST